MVKRRQEPFFPTEEYPAPRLTEDMLAEIVEELKPRPPTPPTVLRPTLVQEIKNAKYKNLTFRTDPATAAGHPGDPDYRWVNHPLGLRGLGIVADTMTIIEVGGGPPYFTYRMNTPTNDETPAREGMMEDQFEIEEIYITTPWPEPAAATAIVRVNYNPFLIRLR